MLKKISFFIILFSVLMPFLVRSETDMVNVGLQVTCPGGRCVKGCMDTVATNYNPLATMDTVPTSCVYTLIIIDIAGCTDSLANNYNAAATINVGCDYAVPNASGLSASYGDSQVFLSWNNPSYAKFGSVRVVKSSSVPAGPSGGEIIYEGSGSSVADDDVVVGARYYYAVYVFSVAGRNSSGAVTSLVIPGAVPVSGCIDPLANNYNPAATIDNGSCRYSEPPIVIDGGTPDSGGGGSSVSFSGQRSPFDIFKNIGTTTRNIFGRKATTPTDFVVSQLGEPDKAVHDGLSLRIRRDKPITIYVPYDKMPEVLKTIGVTIFDPVEPVDTTSIILSYNPEKDRYEATIDAPLYGGTYPVSIYLINYRDQTMKRIDTAFIVPGTARNFLASGALIGQTADAAIVAGGLAAGGISLLASATNIGSVYDFYLFLIRGFGALLGLFGIRRRSKPWGTVYDSVTKRPLDPAYVTVMWNGREMGSAITDIEGRYGFFLTAGEYTLHAAKTHYKFPSDRLAGRQSDELYGDLYFGEAFTTTGQEVINRNIPMDPVDFDWNEFAKTKNNFFKLHTKREVFKSYLFNIIYIAGFILAAVRFLLSPSYFDLLMLIVYLGLYAFQYFWRLRHRVIMVRRANGEPMPFALVRFFLSGVNFESRSIAADEMGRFFILVRPGIYYYTIEEKLSDGSYKKIYQSPDINMPKGVLNGDIVVGEEENVVAENPPTQTPPPASVLAASETMATLPSVSPALPAVIVKPAENG